MLKAFSRSWTWSEVWSFSPASCPHKFSYFAQSMSWRPYWQAVGRWLWHFSNRKVLICSSICPYQLWRLCAPHLQMPSKFDYIWQRHPWNLKVDGLKSHQPVGQSSIIKSYPSDKLHSNLYSWCRFFTFHWLFSSLSYWWANRDM